MLFKDDDGSPERSSRRAVNVRWKVKMIFSHTDRINGNVWAAFTCRQTLDVTALCPCPQVWLWFTCFTCSSKFLTEVKMKYLCLAKPDTGCSIHCSFLIVY